MRRGDAATRLANPENNDTGDTPAMRIHPTALTRGTHVAFSNLDNARRRCRGPSSYAPTCHYGKLEREKTMPRTIRGIGMRNNERAVLGTGDHSAPRNCDLSRYDYLSMKTVGKIRCIFHLFWYFLLLIECSNN